MRDRYSAKYYPLITADDEERHLAPLFPTGDERHCSCRDRPYLSEIISHIFRIHGYAGNKTIHCPYCGKAMKRITKNTEDALYECPRCR